MDSFQIVECPPLSDEVLNRLFSASWPSHAEGTFAPALSRSLVYFGGYLGAQLVGFVNVAWDGGSHAFLLDPTVHPDFRRRGFGLALVDAAIRTATARGVEWFHVDYEPALEPFYRSAGFRPTHAGLLHLPSRHSPVPTEIRPATPLDADAIKTFDEIARVDASRRVFIDRSIATGQCLVATVEGRPVAYAVFNYSFYACGFVEMLYVEQGFRHRGIGTTLMRHIAARCETPKLFTSTNQSNERMQALLSRLGYEPSGIIENLDEGDPELVYVKRLRHEALQHGSPRAASGGKMGRGG